MSRFEVFDKIHDGVLDTSDMVLRRVILSDGLVEGVNE